MAGVVLSAPSSGHGRGASDLSRAEVVAYLAENPGLPLVLPQDLLPGVRWLGPESTDRAEDGLVTVRSSRFGRGELLDGPTVSVCVESPTIPGACPSGDRQVRRRLPTGERVVIALYGRTIKDNELAWWRQVPLAQSQLPAWIP